MIPSIEHVTIRTERLPFRKTRGFRIISFDILFSYIYLFLIYCKALLTSS